MIKVCMLMDDPEKIVDLGEFRGFPMQLRCDGSKFRVTMAYRVRSTCWKAMAMITLARMLMCDKVTHENLIDSPLFYMK